MSFDDTIVAIASPPGSGAIAVIRLSGNRAIEISDQIFYSHTEGKKLKFQKAFTIHYGSIKEGDEPIDDVLVSVYRKPKSYTGEDTVEISCHGSLFIQQKILNLLVKSGARPAKPGEFTQRAFLNGKMDLSQAEAVADLIASESASAHQVAVNQIRGGFTKEFSDLRHQLLSFISLIELELDFSEEDVEFADRKKLLHLINHIRIKISALVNSFELGNVIKNGIPVAIVGEPNVGKSTLLNVLVNEEKALVSDIAGTTRDAVEDVISLNGILFRFIDTAGIRHTDDKIESLGIEKTMQKIENAKIILFMIDAADVKACEQFETIRKRNNHKKFILIANKIDKIKNYNSLKLNMCSDVQYVEISAKHNQNINKLTDLLLHTVQYTDESTKNTIITNSRHYHLLEKTLDSSNRVVEGLNQNIPSDLIAQDIRAILNDIGEITGEFTSDEILGSIFKNFCIGK